MKLKAWPIFIATAALLMSCGRNEIPNQPEPTEVRTQTGSIVIDVSSTEAFEKTMAEINREIETLPTEERMRYAEAFTRFAIDALRAYPNKQELIDFNGPPPKEFMVKLNFKAMQPFHGKTVFEFLKNAEIRAQGRPSFLEDMDQFFQEMEALSKTSK